MSWKNNFIDSVKKSIQGSSITSKLNQIVNKLNIKHQNMYNRSKSFRIILKATSYIKFCRTSVDIIGL